MISTYLAGSVCKLVYAYTFLSSSEILLADCETKKKKDNANEQIEVAKRGSTEQCKDQKNERQKHQANVHKI